MPDGFFGMIKKKCQQECIDGKMEVVECIITSSKDGKSNTTIIYGSGLDQFCYYDLRPFLKDNLVKLMAYCNFSTFTFLAKLLALFKPTNIIISLLYHLIFELKKWQNVDALRLWLYISQGMSETNSAPLPQNHKDYRLCIIQIYHYFYQKCNHVLKISKFWSTKFFCFW